MGERRAGPATRLAVLPLLLVGGCSTEPGPSAEPQPSPAISTLTPLPPPPEEPPTGRLLADMRQSSRDAALGRIQVWLDNDTTAPVTPTRITYTDLRLRSPLVAERLRLAPSQSERGFPLPLPARPACDRAGARGGGTVEVRYGGRTATVPVTDATDVVGRFVRARCTELAVARVAALRWADRVVDPAAGPVEVGDTATLTLLVEPAGAAGRVLLVETVGGTPILSPADGASVWSPRLRVPGDGRPARVALPVKPTRCDPHAFQESAGATALRLRLRLDGEPGELVLRMGPAGTAAALEFARASCGLGDT